MSCIGAASRLDARKAMCHQMSIKAASTARACALARQACLKLMGRIVMAIGSSAARLFQKPMSATSPMRGSVCRGRAARQAPSFNLAYIGLRAWQKFACVVEIASTGIEGAFRPCSIRVFYKNVVLLCLSCRLAWWRSGHCAGIKTMYHVS